MSRPLAERLASPDAGERAAACREAATDPAAALYTAPLARALVDANPRVARAAADALVRLRALEPARAALRDAPPGRRFFAAWTCARLEPPSARLLPALVEALAHPDGDVRWSAARLLVELGRLHGEVLDVLLGLAGTGSAPPVRRMAVFALRALAPDLPEAASALLVASRDPDVHLRRAAYTGLAALVEPPAEVRGRLAEAAACDPDEAARCLAERALALLSREGADPASPR
jgi:HEAT repeat protein